MFVPRIVAVSVGHPRLVIGVHENQKLFGHRSAFASVSGGPRCDSCESCVRIQDQPRTNDGPLQLEGRKLMTNPMEDKLTRALAGVDDKVLSKRSIDLR